MKALLSRRIFIQRTVAAGIGFAAMPSVLSASPFAQSSKMRFGLVTYQWAKDWDLSTIISNCEKAGLKGVELRTQHAHGVE
ncbi:MAG: xylose isomerase, partial [Segetibacter sp.]|nr:xylose isomerase [Segetibacter sp.]